MSSILQFAGTTYEWEYVRGRRRMRRFEMDLRLGSQLPFMELGYGKRQRLLSTFRFAGAKLGPTVIFRRIEAPDDGTEFFDLTAPRGAREYHDDAAARGSSLFGAALMPLLETADPLEVARYQEFMRSPGYPFPESGEPDAVFDPAVIVGTRYCIVRALVSKGPVVEHVIVWFVAEVGFDPRRAIGTVRELLAEDGWHVVEPFITAQRTDIPHPRSISELVHVSIGVRRG